MNRVLFLLAGALFAALPAFSTGSSAPSPESRERTRLLSGAREDAGAENFPRAKRRLDTLLANDPGDFEALLLRARLHSWQGKHAEAERELAALAARDSSDEDVRLAQAYLWYYEGRLQESEREFRARIAAHPDDADARTGLERVEAARAARSLPWRLDAGGEYSVFTRRTQADWKQVFLQVGRAVSSSDIVYVRADRFRQFDLTDAVLEAGATHRFSPDLYASAAAGWTPYDDFKPRWHLSGDAGWRAPAFFFSFPRLEPLLSLWYDVYAVTKVLRTSPGLRVAGDAGWAVTGRWVRVDESGNAAIYGGTARLDGPLPEVGRLNGNFYVGYADAPETVAGNTVATRTLFVGASLPVNAALSFNLGYVRDDREHAYIRHAFDAGFSKRF